MSEINYCPEEVIKELKAQYKTIYSAIAGDQEYIFRPINRKEHQWLLENNANEDTVVQTAVLWPKMDPVSIAAADSGVIFHLVEEIFKCSGFGQVLEVKKL